VNLTFGVIESVDGVTDPKAGDRMMASCDHNGARQKPTRSQRRTVISMVL
jgi:hypothetical protein